MREKIAEIVELFREKSRMKKLDLVVKVHSTVPECVISDEQKITQIIVNLLQNSFKYTNQGSITIEVSYNAAKENVVVQVQDTGIGMKALERKRLKKLLTSNLYQEKVSQNSSGYGIGLLVSNMICRLLGGSRREGLFFKSKPGEQTIFGFQIYSKITQEGVKNFSLLAVSENQHNFDPKNLDILSLQFITNQAESLIDHKVEAHKT